MKPETEIDKELAQLDRLARLLDSAITVPGTRLSIGLDGIAGLIPGVGDSATLVINLYIVWRGAKLGVGPNIIFKMLWNVLVDYVVGLIPVIGDVFDILWKANRRNVALLHTHVTR